MDIEITWISFRAWHLRIHQIAVKDLFIAQRIMSLANQEQVTIGPRDITRRAQSWQIHFWM
jgi:hypothetical protein